MISSIYLKHFSVVLILIQSVGVEDVGRDDDTLEAHADTAAVASRRGSAFVIDPYHDLYRASDWLYFFLCYILLL